MKFLCSVYNWFGSNTSGISGGEIYLKTLMDYLRSQGHEFRMITGNSEPYTEDNIECYPQGEGLDMFTKNNEHVQWCDVIICQLIGSSWGYNKAIQHKKPLIWIAHNNSTGYATRYANELNVIYNSYQLRDDMQKTFGQFNSIVTHPVITNYSGIGDKITLVNCSHNKGGHILGQIAERLPQYQFLGVYGGYQDQIECHLPNVTYLQNGTDMSEVYRQTKILLCPSEFESYSQSAAEALTAGIPVIAHPTPGLKENLAYAGIFIDRNDISKYVNEIVFLMEGDAYYQTGSRLAIKRAVACREMNDTELIVLNKWLLKIK